MNEDQINVLWSLFGFIGLKWGTAADCGMSQQQFQQALQWQMQRDPAYTGYYRDTIAEYQALLRQYGQPSLALAALITQKPYSPSNPSAVANFVLLEFMRWNIAFGGFKAFGYMNYNGWMGGGSFLQQPPPYRALNIPVQNLPVGGDHGQGA
ncbi:hypothetical protein P0D90_07960 [Pseudomonas sp. CBSPCBW29]|nr:hypothetical protein P0D90_07960 [Pseudomonas sp. CBSPCBW29]